MLPGKAEGNGNGNGKMPLRIHIKETQQPRPSFPTDTAVLELFGIELGFQSIASDALRASLVEYTFSMVPLCDDEEETDSHRLSQRMKQIAFGKNTMGYQTYAQSVPRTQRQYGNDNHPVTPRLNYKCPKRSWDGLVGQWRRALHLWDQNPSPDTMRRPSLPTLEELCLESTDCDDVQLMQQGHIVNDASHHDGAHMHTSTPSASPQRDECEFITFNSVTGRVLFSPAPRGTGRIDPITPTRFFTSSERTPKPKPQGSQGCSPYGVAALHSDDVVQPISLVF